MLQELSASPAPARVTLEATGKKIMRFGGERSRHSRHLVRASNAVKRDERVGNLCPWSSTRRHLYHGASQRPNVGRQSLLLLQHDLRCHPERRSIHLPHHTILQVQVLRLQLLLLLPQFHSIDVLGGSEIRELDAAGCIANENILGLDVAMHNSAAMEVIDSLNKTASVRADELLVQGLRSRELLQQIRQAATGHVFQEHVAHPLTTFFFTPVASQTTYHMLRFQALQHPDLVLHCRQRGVPLRIAAAAAATAAHNSRFHCKQRTRDSVHCQIDLPECPYSQQTPANPLPTSPHHGSNKSLPPWGPSSSQTHSFFHKLIPSFFPPQKIKDRLSSDPYFRLLHTTNQPTNQASSSPASLHPSTHSHTHTHTHTHTQIRLH
ncbi:hypothetical protein CY35_14G046900 [Sphagnum magellanicum]|nr:hypothetical protein CY35_14G046900 [Sphagnum magellanicum]